MKKEKILFWIIILTGIIVRIYGWPNVISEVNCDEIMTAINANSIAETGKDIYGTSFPVYLEAWRVFGQSVFLMYCIAICIKIFGISIIAVRLPMLLISIISLFVFYDLCKRIFKSEKVALISLFVLAISPWHILQSIWSIDCNMFPHMLLISIYVLYRGLDTKKLLYLSMILFGITMYTYGEAIYIVPFLLLIIGIYLLKKKEISIKQLVICIILYLLVSLPILTMFFLNGFGIDKNISIGPITIQYFKDNVRTGDMLFFSDNIGSTLLNNIKCLFKTIFMQYDNLEWNATKEYGTIYLTSIIFVIIAIANIIQTKKKDGKLSKEKFILISWLIISLFLGIIINNVNINRLNVVWYPLILLTGYGISLLFEKNKIIGKIIIIIYSIIFITFTIYLNTEYGKIIDMSGCFSKNYLKAIKYADSLSKEELIYSNTTKDGSLEVYIKFQTTVDKQKYTEITDNNEILENIDTLSENQVLLIKNEEYSSDELIENNYKVEKFNNYLVVYK